MPNLFGLDIAGIVNDNLGSQLLDATLIQVVEGTRSASDPTAGLPTSNRNIPCKGIIDEYLAREIDGTIVQTGDRKILLLGKSIKSGTVVPATGDKIKIEGVVYRILDIKRDPAAATYVCQARID